MKNFKFGTPKMYRDIFTPGKLSELAEEVFSGKAAKDIKRLTPDEFAKVPAIYSSFNPREISVLELEDDKEYTTTNKQNVLGRDIKAITMLMYDKPRTAYINFGSVKQVHQSIYSGAVPTVLLGYKRFWNIEYDQWRAKYEGHAYIDPSNYTVVEKEGDLELAFKIDVLLGNSLASTRYDASTDTIVWNDKGYGLLLLSTIRGKGYRPNIETLDYLRTKGMGNYPGTYATSYGSARIEPISYENIDNDILIMHNKASKPMRLLMSQRWAWYGNHRCSDMICDFQDWAYVPKSRDTLSMSFTGLKTKDAKPLAGIAAHFGIGN